VTEARLHVYVAVSAVGLCAVLAVTNYFRWEHGSREPSTSMPSPQTLSQVVKPVAEPPPVIPVSSKPIQTCPTALEALSRGTPTVVKHADGSEESMFDTDAAPPSRLVTTSFNEMLLPGHRVLVLETETTVLHARPYTYVFDCEEPVIVELFTAGGRPTIHESVLIVTSDDYGENDPSCCPRMHMKRTVRIVDGVWTEEEPLLTTSEYAQPISDSRIDHLGQEGAMVDEESMTRYAGRYTFSAGEGPPARELSLQPNGLFLARTVDRDSPPFPAGSFNHGQWVPYATGTGEVLLLLKDFGNRRWIAPTRGDDELTLLGEDREWHYTRRQGVTE
jgi:hypothetical protein